MRPCSQAEVSTEKSWWGKTWCSEGAQQEGGLGLVGVSKSGSALRSRHSRWFRRIVMNPFAQGELPMGPLYSADLEPRSRADLDLELKKPLL